ncbi:benzil reductase ((S)-benzoin forming) [Peribacillus deserti]|uniref:Benzil reductase ((S)-benzoin forming) n=1 Tax=Peribacillus deserti TaxID=673318 RepID=A0ABS2QDK6_9BACI|nr:(S)-benzoin forming benzil reductase [Peribacillus deserti]MBM7691182.1 benzil reductase ((S)-benzoin forming) [Peribacillus deserti]
MAYAIITGASTGLGEAAALKLVEEGIKLISVSRRESQKLKEKSLSANVSYSHFSCDLSSSDETISVFGQIAEQVLDQEKDIVYLINNAGVVEPIETVGNLDFHDIISSIQVNLTAPIMITNLFLEKAKDSEVKVNVMNITSGAGERPIQGWSIYGSTKAALNLFTKTAALEAEHGKKNFMINAFSPGIMDTNMQHTIRSSGKEAFNDLEKFLEYRDKGLLRSPEQVGSCLVKLLISGDLENGRIYYVNDLLK